MHEPAVDLFVIGGGSAGVRAARRAAQRGARVVLAEPAAMGGTCVNLGCIPKKLYSYAAHYGAAFDEARGYGWKAAPPVFDWETLKRNRAREIHRLNGVYEDLLAGAGVQVLRGRARVVAADAVQVDDRVIRARHIAVATGSRPVVPTGARCEGVITSDEVFDLPEFPRRLVVVGGGYIACEFAAIFNGLGAQVTQLYRGEQILRGFDDDVRDFVAAEMRKSGVDLRIRTDVRRIGSAAAGIRLELNDATSITADRVLYATGRSPNTAGLGRAEVGVQLGTTGAVQVDADYRSSVATIHALGDVIDRVQLTPVALAEASALVDRLFGGGPGTLDYALIPTAVFTYPNVATVGLTEAQARERNAGVHVFRSEFRSLKHTLSGSAQRTLVKLVVDARSDRVLGVHMVGEDAGEIVQGFAVALKAGATKQVFDSTLGIHPTAAEEFVTLREPLLA
jgi:glutathione reductase (NADPH)